VLVHPSYTMQIVEMFVNNYNKKKKNTSRKIDNVSGDWNARSAKRTCAMTGRQIRRLLYGLLILALFVIVLHSGRSAYWLAKDGHYSERSRLHAEAPTDYGEQQVGSLLEDNCTRFWKVRIRHVAWRVNACSNKIVSNTVLEKVYAPARLCDVMLSVSTGCVVVFRVGIRLFRKL